jgi:hypothetical protein
MFDFFDVLLVWGKTDYCLFLKINNRNFNSKGSGSIKKQEDLTVPALKESDV